MEAKVISKGMAFLFAFHKRKGETMLATKAVFNRKVDDFEPKSCVIEKVIALTSQDYDEFSQNMLADYDFIKDNIDLQYCDNNGVFHCLMVVGEDRKDGILVESEGSGYARYSAFLPNAAEFLATAMEQERSAEKKTVVPGLKLKDLMTVSLEDIYLIHSDEDIELATICELKNDTLTSVGKEEWSDILDADVHRIFNGIYGLQIEVSDVKPQRLSEFSFMLAGHCSEQDYAKWVTQESGETFDESSNGPQPEHQKIKVVMVEPHKSPYIAEIGNDLSSMQESVGGYIQAVDLEPHVSLICNEEGKLLGLEGNRSLDNDVLVGNFFIAGNNDEGEFTSLTDEQIEKYTQRFFTPESFTKEQIDETANFTTISF